MNVLTSHYSEKPIHARTFNCKTRAMLIICEPDAPYGNEISLQMESRFGDKLARIAAAINEIMAEPNP